MSKLDKIEQATKIVLSIAAVGTLCKIGLERHRSHMAFRKKVREILTAIGPHEIESPAGEFVRFCMELVSRP